MQKIYKEKIIGFEIVYNDIEHDFELQYVYEGADPQGDYCGSFYIPFNGIAFRVFWESEYGDLDPFGAEFVSCGGCEYCNEEWKEFEETE